MEPLILIGLILLNGIFAMSEIALVTARKARLIKLAEDGDSAASTALKLGEDPTRFLSTVQIGITSIGILNGIVGESVLAAPFAIWLAGLGVADNVASIGATAFVVIVVTYVTIVLGELVPKRLGQLNPESVARLVARPMQILASVTRPFVFLLTASTHGILRLFGVKQNAQSSVTEEEIHAILDEGSEAGVIEERQHAMLRNVFRLDDRQLASLMIPRSDMVYVDTRRTPEENLQLIVDSQHSRYLVCEGGLENLLGVVHSKQILASLAKGQPPDFSTHLQPTIFVPETLTGTELLEQFRVNHMPMAFVVDEYGEIEGMVTLADVLEAVTGEFTPRNPKDSWGTRRADGSWLLDGAIPIPELKDRLELKGVPEEDKGRYHTVSGMMMMMLGRIPAAGDYVDWESWRFEVADMDDLRIDKVLASRIPATTNAG
jgi:putative hemolysin